MNNAIIFIRDSEEQQLSKTPYLGGNLLLHAVKEVRKVSDMRNIYVVGAESDVPGCITSNNIASIVSQV